MQKNKMNELTTVGNTGFLQSQEEINKVANILKEHRKSFEEKKTPEQHKGKLPMGGKLVDYVKSPYMINLMKEFCKEIYNIKIVEIKDVSMPTSTLPEHWVRISLEVLNRSTNNSYPGVGASRVRTNSDGTIINYRHDLAAAETYALKDVAKNMGISADIYGRDVDEYTEQTQAKLNTFLPEIRKRYGKDDYERFLTKMETFGTDEERLLKFISDLEKTWTTK
jgi:hypothetical protein